MGGYVEVMVRGDCRAILSASDFAGVLTSPGMGSTEPATPDCPVSIVLRSGAQIDGIYGISASKLLVYMEGARMLTKHLQKPLYVVFIDSRQDFEMELNALLSQVPSDG